MNILVVTNSCSAKKYKEICEMRRVASIDPQQKFFRLMITGIGENNVNVSAISALPISGSTVKKRIFKAEKDFSEKNVSYTYLPFINGKLLRYITLNIATRYYIKKWCKGKKNKETVIVLDPLVPMIAIPTRKIAQKKGIPVIAVVTDIPTLATNMKGRKNSLLKDKFMVAFQKTAYNDLYKYDGYIPLTESLNDKINIHHKPSLVVEGFADSSDTSVSDVHEKYLMYAGGVYEKYGVKTLVEAFINIGRTDFDLLIFGEGPYTEKLQKIQQDYPNVQYKGCVSPDEIVKYEKRAYLLVNPRPTNEEFSKYSFPSKTMEYMLSGTPVISTKLSGIPDDYFEYMFAFSDYDESSVRKDLETILNTPYDTLLEHGIKGHNFILREKNNVIMSSKILGLLERI